MKHLGLVTTIVLTGALTTGCAALPHSHQKPATTTNAPAHPQTQQQQAHKRIRVDFFLAQTRADKGLSRLKLPKSTVWYVPKPVLTRADLHTVEPRKTKNGQAFVRFTFSHKGATKLAKITQRFPHKLFLVTLGKKLLAIYRLNGHVTNGRLDVGLKSARQAIAVARVIAGKPAQAQ